MAQLSRQSKASIIIPNGRVVPVARPLEPVCRVDVAFAQAERWPPAVRPFARAR
jgi:hypothetical protein